MFYFVKTPWLVKKWYADCTWNIPTIQKIIYLTFDDGPHPVATPFVLDELKKYKAAATFFCIGKNVIEHPQLYRRILEENHGIGNHTHNHLNGWKTTDKEYFQNIREAAKFIDSKLFRPPYGRITHFQIKNLRSASFQMKVIMWDVLSADFDHAISPQKCVDNVINHTKNGSIVIFHDSEKAFRNLKTALPKMLDHFSRLGYSFEGIR